MRQRLRRKISQTRLQCGSKYSNTKMWEINHKVRWRKPLINPKLHGLIDSQRPWFLERLNCGFTLLLHWMKDAPQSSVFPLLLLIFRVEAWRLEIRDQTSMSKSFPWTACQHINYFILFFVFGLFSLHGSGFCFVFFSIKFVPDLLLLHFSFSDY